MIRHLLLTLFAFVCLAVPQAHALSVSPLQIDMNTSGGGSYATVVARNTTDRTISVESRLERRDIGFDGRQNLVPDDSTVLVFPPLAQIAPGAAQSFRVQWIGEPSGGDYYVTIAQLPITDDRENTTGAQGEARFRLRLGYAFKIAVRAAPAGSRANLVAQSQGPGSTSDGRPALRVLISNNGSRSTSLAGFSAVISSSRGTTEIPPSAWSQSMPNQLFPAGHSRTVNIPVPDASWANGGTIRFKPVR